MYEFVVTEFGTTKSETRMACSTREAAVRFAATAVAPQCVIFVAHIVGHVDHGNFYAWCNGDVAHVRLDEHREHYASDPLRASAITSDVIFRGEDGEPLEVPSTQVISRAQATDALHCWLTSGSKLSSLSWS